MQALPGSVDARQHKTPKVTFSQRMPLELNFRRHSCVGGRISAANAYETSAPASLLLRRALLVRNPVGNRPSGVTFSPEGAFSQQQRTRPSLRRHFFAEGPFSYGIPSEVLVPASLSRRGAHFCSECVRDLPSGVIFSPEGDLSQRMPLELTFRRRFLARGRVIASARPRSTRLRVR